MRRLVHALKAGSSEPERDVSCTMMVCTAVQRESAASRVPDSPVKPNS
jgi:hypothetical protein